MTTQIVILNLGPDPIVVEPVGRDSDGKFIDAGEPVEVQPGSAYGGLNQRHVHSGLSYTVKEKPRG